MLSSSSRAEAHLGPFSTGSRIGGRCKCREASTSGFAIADCFGDCRGGRDEVGESASLDRACSYEVFPKAVKSPKSGK